MSLIVTKAYINLGRKFNIFTKSNIRLPKMSFVRKFSEDPSSNEFFDSSILVENGCNVQELPVIVRKYKCITKFDHDDHKSAPHSIVQDNPNYHLIQAEFKDCYNLRDVFCLLSKCTKITPNIALGAMERINELEKRPPIFYFEETNIVHINSAKGAILDKLLKVVMKTDDTQTILNVLESLSSFVQPYKYKFCDEILRRVLDNKLSINQLCQFTSFLIENKSNPKYFDIIDKLWVAFLEKIEDINEKNIVNIYKILPGLKISKRTMTLLIEQKLSEVWNKINVFDMQVILNIFIKEKYLSQDSYAIAGKWLNTNIHLLDEDTLLDIITKFQRLNYTNIEIEKTIEKYLKLKSTKVNSPILLVGILNYCMHFNLRNLNIMKYGIQIFNRNGKSLPVNFLKSFVYPYGYLYFDSDENNDFWISIENLVISSFDKMNCSDTCSIILAYLYIGIYPEKIVKKLYSPENLLRIKNKSTSKNLYLIDTALTLEHEDYSGPLLPKDKLWDKSVNMDNSIENLIRKMKSIFIDIAGGNDRLSTSVLIPNLCSHQTYLIDVMLHSVGQGDNTFNWNLKSDNEKIALLIHLPEHYCSDQQLIGPQMMRKKHLSLLGFKVVSLDYTVICKFQLSDSKPELKTYILNEISSV